MIIRTSKTAISKEEASAKIIFDENIQKKSVDINIIINNGKIIFGYEFKSDEDILYYNILISSKIENSNIIQPEIIQCFEKEEKERDIELEKLKKEKCDINNNMKNNEIILIRPLLLNKNLEKEKDILLSLLNYINISDKEIKINFEQNNKFIEENYFLVNGIWFNSFLYFFQYNDFIQRNINNDDFNKKIINKIKQKNEFDINNYLPEECIKIVEEKNISYFDNFKIINEQTKNQLEKFLGIKFEERNKLLFSETKVIISFKNDSLLLGTFNKKMFFQIEMLFKLIDNYVEYYLTKFKEKGFSKVIQKIKDFSIDKKINLIKKDGNYRGTIYNIKLIENNNKSINNSDNTRTEIKEENSYE